MKPFVDHRGALIVYPRRDGRQHIKFVHQLVLETFIGPCPDGMETCHFPDRYPGNCNLWNLRWDTAKSNSADKEIHGTLLRGSLAPTAKLTELQVKEIRRLFTEGRTSVSVAAMFGVSRNITDSIRKGITYRLEV